MTTFDVDRGKNLSLIFLEKKEADENEEADEKAEAETSETSDDLSITQI